MDTNSNFPALSVPLSDGRHQCILCPHRCSLRNEQPGLCGVREANGSSVYLKAYGKLTQAAVEPIEKKPIWHYKPGLKTLSIGSFSCNLRCNFCQNFMVSQSDRSDDSRFLLPQDLINLAKSKNCQAICFTYNEPIIYFEYIVDVAKIAKKENLDIILKTNAYIEKDPWLYLLQYVDALNIDWKGTNEQYRTIAKADDSVIYDRIQEALELNKYVEISVPVYYNSKIDDLSHFRSFIANYNDTPIHLLKIFPAYKSIINPATPDKLLFRIKNYLSEKLNYVYIANIFNDTKEHQTVCKNCGKLLIERESLKSTIHLKEQCCNQCPIHYGP